ncbi:MAG: DNA polymerase III subunit beta, partial [Candidatus Levybacteria bacterium]|nr:DNA polymerase III subunit beta [Candidatus Levybacteria bacterium]
MKVNIQTNKLQSVLPSINRAISTKSQLPILSHFLMEAKGKLVQLSSTDLEIGMQTTIPADIEKEGSVAMPAKTFSDLVMLLSDDKITIEKKDNTVEVVTAKTKSSFQTMVKEDFPKLYEDKGELLASIPAGELRENIAPIIFSASNDPARPALSGVLVKRESQRTDGGFLLVATDGYRLSLKHYALEKQRIREGKEGASLIVPARVFREILSMKNEEGEVSIFISPKNNQALFVQGETTLVGRLIGDEYPNFERIIPTDCATKVLFEREEMLRAIKMCSVFARETANIVKLELKKDTIFVSSRTPSLGDNIVEVEAKLVGEENEIAFNVRYLLD